MIDDNTISKLAGDVLREELKALDAVERWGSSLFLGAIALIAKQIIDWGQVPEGKTAVGLYAPIYMLPAVIGLFSFVFLRFVNFRIRRTRDRLYNLAKLPERLKFSPGSIGWLMSFMPLLLGYGASWYFSIGKPELGTAFWCLMLIGLTSVGVALVVFVCSSFCKSR